MKINKFVWKILALLLCIATLFPTLSACNGDDYDYDSDQITKLSFKASSGYDYLKTLDGTLVSISGYMATSSPIDGSFMFLMNLPYQSCPFCVPNTSQLSNTMEVYPKKGERFDYTTQAIQVVGKLVVSESEDQPFTDDYGYQFTSKIVDATYRIIKAEELAGNMALWQEIASSNVVNEIYKMYDYVNFLCNWNTYFINSYVDANGNTQPGYYLYPADAEYLIYTANQQFNYGYKEGYFESIIAKIKNIDENAFSDLISNIQNAKSLAIEALGELESQNYTYEYKYVEKFGTTDKVYTLTNGERLQTQMNTLYYEFSNWLGSWEM